MPPRRRKDDNAPLLVRVPVANARRRSGAGSLRQYGYHTSLRASERHTALERAIAGLRSAETVVRKLSVPADLNKNTNPRAAGILRRDIRWVVDRYMCK